MADYLHLKGFSTPESANANSFTEQLAENLEEFFNWGLLQAGAYDDVPVSSPGTADPYDESNLTPVHMAGTDDGRIWQSPHRNWVWEGGLSSDRQPIPISGVYVDGTFYDPSTSGDFSYFLDYPNGRVVFANAISTSSVVQVGYSHRWVGFYDQDVPWFRDVIFDAYLYEVGPTAQPSGILSLLHQYSVELPAVVIETVPQRRFKPRQLGDASLWVYPDFLFHIIAENKADRDFIQDAISLQKDKGIYLFDTNARSAAGQYAFDWHGSVQPGAMTYPQLVDLPPSGFRYKTCFFNRVAGEDSSSLLPLFRATLRVTLEVEFTDL